MEVIWTLGLIIVAIWLLSHHGWIRRLQQRLWDSHFQVEGMTKWSHGFYRDVLTLRGQVDALARRIEELERKRVESQEIPTGSEPVGRVEVVSSPAAVRGQPSAITTEPLPVQASHTGTASAQFESTEGARAASTELPITPIASAIAAAATAAAAPSAAETAREVPIGVDSSRVELESHPALSPNAPFEQPAGDSARTATPDPTPVAAPEPKRQPKIDWESWIGVRLFSWIAGLSLLLGAIFFLRYSAENGWLSPPIRMIMGLVVGSALLVTCELKGRDYRVTANAMDAAGIGTLFATSFAGNAVWHLIPASVTFLLLVLVTALAVLLSMRRNSLIIALLGLVGGFATPVLLSTGENRPLGLFSYLMLLNVALGLLGYRQRWPILLCLSMGLTILYQWGWVGKFVIDDSGQLPIAAAVFLLFPLVWIGMNRAWMRRKAAETPAWIAELLSWGAALPLLLALAMAWLPEFGQRYLLMFGYLLVLDLGLLVLDWTRPKDRLANIAAFATLAVWVGWLQRNYVSDAWPSVTALWALFVLVFLCAPVVGKRAGNAVSLARFAAPVLLLVAALLVFVEPATMNPFLLFGVLLGLLGAISAVAVWWRDGWLYYSAIPFAILAQACWSSRWLGASRLVPGLIIYVTFALFFVAVPLVARRLTRTLEPAGLATLVAPLNLTLILFLAYGTVAPRALWMIGVMLTILNVSAFIEARHSRRHRAALVSIALSWAIIIIWWVNAMIPGRLLAGLVVVLALVLLSVGGILWLKTTRDDQAPDRLMDQGPLLGLVGHLFLLFVATQPQLNTPPWSLLGITLVLDLAMIAASLYLGRALFAAVALALSQAIVAVWIVAARNDDFGLRAAEVALLSMLVVATLGALLPWLARRRQLDELGFVRGGNGTLLLGQVLLVELGAVSDPPRLLALLSAQFIVMGLVLIGAGVRAQHRVALISWVIASIGAFAWAVVHLNTDTWNQLLALAFVPYTLLTVYPVYCHHRCAARRWPFVLAICGSLSFFAAAYSALKLSPWSGALGVLPLLQSLITAGLLLYLLRVVEPRTPRDVGRLALVAATALGFATTAIPLQLENEWLTIAWALEAVVVAWLYRRLRHNGLIAASLALSTAVTVRLVANPEVFLYHIRSSTPLFNFYLYTYLVAATALYLASWYVTERTEPKWRFLDWTHHWQRAFGTALLFVLLNIEIADFHSEGATITFRFSSTLAQDLSYTLGWAAFAIGMLITGILLRGRAARIAALVLLTATIAKCFLHDLWRLGGLYRVGSFVGLALCLALVAIMLQRFVLRTASSAPSEEKS